MKKRILALALAGTTAFSVFGAAMSANAYYVQNANGDWIQYKESDSTHVRYGNDEYVPYGNVAEKITISADTTQAVLNSAPVYKDAEGNYYADPEQKYKEDEEYTALKDGKGACWEAEGAFLESAKLIPVTVDDDKKVKIGDKEYKICTNDEAPDWHIYSADATDTDGYDTVAKTGKTFYVANPDAGETIEQSDVVWNSLPEAVDAYMEKNNLPYAYISWTDLDGDSHLYIPGLTAVEAGKVPYATEIVNGSIEVDGVYGANDNTEYSDWYFNSATTVSDTPISMSHVVTDWGNDGKLTTYSEYDATIFAYDFVYVNQLNNTAANIAKAWNTPYTSYLKDTNKNGKEDPEETAAAKVAAENAAAAAFNGTTTLVAEKGDGKFTYGVRYDVVSDWVDFLDELAINHDNGYRETLNEFIANYTERYYGDPVYDPNTGKLLGYNTVDLYNLDQLLTDIYALSAKSRVVGGWITGWENANTSEMVYLMQQYDKYFENYVPKDEVATGEWGEFLLEILNAAEADDFKKAADYKKYINRVEDLADAYEEATTVNMIKLAEEGMYDLLTDTNSSYKAAGSVDKAALGATMEGLYFNIGTPTTKYVTAPSTASTNVDYKTYDYYVAVATPSANNTDWSYSATLTPGFYSLYPMADYVDTTYTNKAAVYNGNDGATDYAGYVTEEYEWFWNVYQLAANMNADNTKQGSIDAINEALNEAVAALEVTSTPKATETSALDEMVEEYEGKIESDYIKGYYDKYVQANDYAEVAEGKQQTRIARYIVGVAGEALTYQGTQNTVTKVMINNLNAAIKDGKEAIESIKNSDDYNAAQVTALNKAIAVAQNIIDKYNGTAENKVYGDERDGQSVNHVYSSRVGDKDQFVISDIDAAIEGIDAAIKGSTTVQGWSKNAAGDWQYGEGDKYLNDGWKQIDKVWYYFDADGTAKQSEWMQENGKWYWFNSNCGAAIGWAKVDNQWYYFGGDNAMKTGWQKVDGNWYYLASSGRMITGWAQVDGKWYYMSKESNSLGQMLANTTTPDGYKVGADGAMIEK